jgi:hypothetical protein
MDDCPDSIPLVGKDTGQRNAIKRAVKRRGSVEAAKQAPNVSFRNGSV